MASSEMLAFWQGYLSILADFLASEPVIWFVGLYVGWFTLCLIKFILNFNKSKY